MLNGKLKEEKKINLQNRLVLVLLGKCMIAAVVSDTLLQACGDKRDIRVELDKGISLLYSAIIKGGTDFTD